MNVTFEIIENRLLIHSEVKWDQSTQFTDYVFETDGGGNIKLLERRNNNSAFMGEFAEALPEYEAWKIARILLNCQ